MRSLPEARHGRVFSLQVNQVLLNRMPETRLEEAQACMRQEAHRITGEQSIV